MERSKKQDKASNPGRTNEEISYARNLWASSMLEVRGPFINPGERAIRRFNRDIICANSARINAFVPHPRAWPILDWEIVVGERYKNEAQWLWPCFSNDLLGFFTTGRMTRFADMIPEYLWYVGEVLECPEFQNEAMLACFRNNGEEFHRLSLQGVPDILKVTEILPIDGTFSYHKLFNYISDRLIWDALQGGTKWLGWVNRGGPVAKEVARAQVEAAKSPPPEYPPFHPSNHHKYLHVIQGPRVLRCLNGDGNQYQSIRQQQSIREDMPPKVIGVKREGSPRLSPSKKFRIYEDGDIPEDDEQGHIHPSRRAFVSVSPRRMSSADAKSQPRGPLKETQNNSKRGRRRPKHSDQALKTLIEEAQSFNNTHCEPAAGPAPVLLGERPHGRQSLLPFPVYSKPEKKTTATKVTLDGFRDCQSIEHNDIRFAPGKPSKPEKKATAAKLAYQGFKDWFENDDVHFQASKSSGLSFCGSGGLQFSSARTSNSNNSMGVALQEKDKSSYGVSVIVPKDWNVDKELNFFSKTYQRQDSLRSNRECINDMPEDLAIPEHLQSFQDRYKESIKAYCESQAASHILDGNDLASLYSFPESFPNSIDKQEIVFSISSPVQPRFKLLAEKDTKDDMNWAKDDDISLFIHSNIISKSSALVAGSKVKDLLAQIEDNVSILDG